MGSAHTRLNFTKTLLPLFTVLVVAMIIFPIPALVLDVMLAANMAFCILLLLASLFISEPDRFTSLPSLLLLSTLFRLGLSISSTRLILSGVQVPEVIIAFGNFVVGGSTIVGLVVFAIISIIQFVVIAKGSERVAEVAARFTLDAMPGKQMSIDADMRAGLLSIAEAREKRRELHRESKLYGALDGAMKFVKGDAIVGLFIIFVNITAGFIIGVTRDGLSLTEAVTRYTLLTIGDGLVSQIPAVLVSVAAGVVITRVSEDEGGMLSDEIGKQLLREPTVLLVSASVLFLLAFLPGLPFLPFLCVSIVPAYYWKKSLKKEIQSGGSNKKSEYQFVPKILPPLVVSLSAEGAFRLQKEESISSYIEAIRAEIFDTRGVLLPDVCFDIDPQQMRTTAELLLDGQSKGMVMFDPDAVVSPGEQDPWSRLVGHLLKSQVSNAITEFVNDAHTRRLLDLYEPFHLDLINALLPQRISVTFLTVLLRELVSDGVSVRDFVSVMQALTEHYHLIEQRDVPLPAGRIKGEAVRAVRRRLMPKWVKKNFSADEPLQVYVLDRVIEERVLSHAEADISVHPDVYDLLSVELHSVCKSSGNKKSILLLHPLVREVIGGSLYAFKDRLDVLSYEEIPNEFQVNVISRIGEVMEEVYEEAA